MQAHQRRACSARRPARAQRGGTLSPPIQRVWDENHRVYGVGKIWKQPHRQRVAVARCTVARLMRRPGIARVVRGKPPRTTRPDPARPCPLHRLNRQFKADRPDRLWVSDYTYVWTWKGSA